MNPASDSHWKREVSRDPLPYQVPRAPLYVGQDHGQVRFRWVLLATIGIGVILRAVVWWCDQVAANDAVLMHQANVELCRDGLHGIPDDHDDSICWQLRGRR